jgi:ubiquinone/menaquinone biosynthesis C-methylase UbiE
VSDAEERLGNDPSSELWGEHRSRYRFAAQFVAGQRVLDVACGSGFGLRMLTAARARAIGVDYDDDTLEQIRREQPSATIVRADATQLPLETASVDQVVSFETIEHVPDACAMVGELRRVLRPGGHLVLSTPNRAFGPLERHTANRFHVREFTADELRALFADCFTRVQLFGQRPMAAYRYVPFLMVDAHTEPSALAWKLMVRLPDGLRNRLALALSGRPFYPGETDYCFDAEATDGAHALVAVAR